MPCPALPALACPALPCLVVPFGTLSHMDGGFTCRLGLWVAWPGRDQSLGIGLDPYERSYLRNKVTEPRQRVIECTAQAMSE